MFSQRTAETWHDQKPSHWGLPMWLQVLRDAMDTAEKAYDLAIEDRTGYDALATLRKAMVDADRTYREAWHAYEAYIYDGAPLIPPHGCICPLDPAERQCTSCQNRS